MGLTGTIVLPTKLSAAAEEIAIRQFDESATSALLKACAEHTKSAGAIRAINKALYTGANINKQDLEGNTPLLFLCKNNTEAGVKHALEYGAKKSINSITTQGISPLLAACKRNLPEGRILPTVDLLLSQISKEEENQPILNMSLIPNLQALDFAIARNYKKIVEAITNSASFQNQHIISIDEIIAALQGNDIKDKHYLQFCTSNYSHLTELQKEEMIQILRGGYVL